LYRRENEALGFTHVDVVSAMARRWRLPELLIKPIELHHMRPTDLRKTEPVHRLHRIAYAVGLLQLQPDSLTVPGNAALHGDGSAVTAQKLLGISEVEVMDVINKSLTEYNATIEAFGEFACAIHDLDGLIERVHVGLVRSIDESIEQSIERQEEAAPDRVAVGAQSIEMVQTEDGSIAYLYDSHGHRLVTHRFPAGDISLQNVCEAFGLELTDPVDRERLTSFIKNLAA
jgi:hypothetical protein